MRISSTYIEIGMHIMLGAPGGMYIPRVATGAQTAILEVYTKEYSPALSGWSFEI